MRYARPGPPLLVGLIGLAVLLYLVIIPSCGSGTPSNFAAAPDAQVDPDLAAAVAAWLRAQETGDENALAALYDPDYDFNGLSAADMAELHVLPETPDYTEVRLGAYRKIGSHVASAFTAPDEQDTWSGSARLRYNKQLDP